MALLQTFLYILLTLRLCHSQKGDKTSIGGSGGSGANTAAETSGLTEEVELNTNTDLTIATSKSGFQSSSDEQDTMNSINWIKSEDVTLPGSFFYTNAVTLHFNEHFILFGGEYNGHIHIGYPYDTYSPTPEPTARDTASYSKDTSTTTTTTKGTGNTGNVISNTPNPTSKPTSYLITSTPAPISDYGIAQINWGRMDYGLYEWQYDAWQMNAFECSSQCHSTVYNGVYFMTRQECDKKIWLYFMDLNRLIYQNKVVIKRFNLTEFLYNETIFDLGVSTDSSNTHYFGCDEYEIAMNYPSVATNSDYNDTNIVYIVYRNKLLSFNVITGEGDLFPFTGQREIDNEYREVPHILHNSSAIFDATGKHLWINSNGGYLWRFDAENRILTDISARTFNRTTNEMLIANATTKNLLCGDDCYHFYYQPEDKHSRFVLINDGFLMLTSDDRDYVFLPNMDITLNNASQYPKSRTEYIDLVCVGRKHDKYFDWRHANTPMFPGGANNQVMSFGGFEFSNIRVEVLTSLNGTQQVYDLNLTSQIRYYAFLYDYFMVIEISDSILFGDAFEFNFYLDPSCDLSAYPTYYGSNHLIPESDFLLVEMRMTSANPTFGIDKYIYFVNATAVNKDDGDSANHHVNTYQACLICSGQVTFDIVPRWNDDGIQSALDSDAACNFCEDGMPFPSTITEEQTDETHALAFEILTIRNPTDIQVTLQSTTKEFTILECAPGFGVSEGAATVDCNACPFNQFSLQDSLNPCVSCRGVSSDALLCEGGKDVMLTYNMWVATWKHHDKEMRPLMEISTDYNETMEADKIVTALCPPGYCCQDVNGCDYYSQYLKRPTQFDAYFGNGEFDEDVGWIPYDADDPTFSKKTYWNITTEKGKWKTDSSKDADVAENGLLCAFGRDVEVALCGKCLDGWAELLGTTQCGDCREGGSAISIIAFTFFITLCLALYILFIDALPIESASKLSKKEIMIQDDTTGFTSLLFKPILYYFQSLSPILDTRGVTLWLSPVLAFFNFSFDTIGGQDRHICFNETLDATGEILLNLLLPAMLVINLMLPRLFIDGEGYGSFPCCCCLSETKIVPLKMYQTPYFASAFFRVLLISIGVVLTVCFKYLTYVKIEELNLMFYSADKEAFGGWWFGGLFGVLFVLYIFALIFYLIRKQEPEERYATTSIYRKFVKSFKKEYWYWEFVLFSRRFVIALFTSIQFVGEGYTNFIFSVVLMIYFWLQIYYKPFAYSRVNKIESLCLLLLGAAFTAANHIHIDDKDQFVGFMLSLCILIPLLIVWWYGIKLVIHRVRWRKYDDDDKKISLNQSKKSLQRAPKSFRTLTIGIKNGARGELDDKEDFDECGKPKIVERHSSECHMNIMTKKHKSKSYETEIQLSELIEASKEMRAASPNSPDSVSIIDETQNYDDIDVEIDDLLDDISITALMTSTPEVDNQQKSEKGVE